MSSCDDATGNTLCRNGNDFALGAGPRPSNPPATRYSASDLLDRRKGMRSEIEVLDELIRDKYEELSQLEPENASADTSERDADTASAGSSEPAYKTKLKRVVRAIVDLNEFTSTDGLNENVVDEYVRHLERNYDQILILGADAVRSLKDAPRERVNEFLDARRAAQFAKVLLVLKDSGHYSLVLFNASNASFYHYDAADKHNSELAEQLVFKLRRYFGAEQLVEVERESQYTESPLYTVDSMMKIILTAEDETSGDVSPVQVLNLPSQPDYLKIIIMSRYIVTKLEQIENVIADDNAA